MYKKNIFTSGIIYLIIGVITYAQAPPSFNYQAKILDNEGQPLKNKNISIQTSIIQGSIDGMVIYKETFSVTSNSYGLISLPIGTGNTSDDFSSIDWSSGPFFLNLAIDTDGGTDYVIIGTFQLLSVPYAFHANTAGNIFSGNYNDLANRPDLSVYLTSENDPKIGNNKINYFPKWNGSALVYGSLFDSIDYIGTNSPFKAIGGIFVENSLKVNGTTETINLDLPMLSKGGIGTIHMRNGCLTFNKLQDGIANGIFFDYNSTTSIAIGMDASSQDLYYWSGTLIHDILRIAPSGRIISGYNVGPPDSLQASFTIQGMSYDSTDCAFQVIDSASSGFHGTRALFIVRNDGRVQIPNGYAPSFPRTFFVNGDIGFSGGQLYVPDGDVNAPAIRSSNNDKTGFAFNLGGANRIYFIIDGSSKGYINSAGWYSIGGIYASTEIGSSNSSARIRLDYPESGDLSLRTGSGNYTMVLKGSGNVGIGTTAPSHLLDVKGDIYSNGKKVLTIGDKTFQTLTVSSMITWDISKGHNAKMSGALISNATLTLNNAVNGDEGTLLILNGANDYVLTLPPSSYIEDPSGNTFTISAGTNKRTLLKFIYDGSNYWWTFNTYTL